MRWCFGFASTPSTVVHAVVVFDRSLKLKTMATRQGRNAMWHCFLACGKEVEHVRRVLCRRGQTQSSAWGSWW
ncbi:hypothetical protein CBR_g51660 [Chara braunii]|uniref:Uncharacterized protein n=1 Tax=Chara braunii TaxID=69332 RepID=A0A388M966_CHABU|nr:hypothetical protein CBR_g51660 [Chara braunii]|eukprot:GBG91002.1 hypothetical protein CBR_g51660 [Chara braunii]